MKANGFLVSQQEKHENGVLYFGIDTNAWPVGEEKFDEIYDCFQSQRLRSLLDETILESQTCCLLGLDMVTPYITFCNENNITNRVLYVEMHEDCVFLDCDLHNRWAILDNFMGYDVGYCASFECYSALLSDVICRPELFPDLFKRLNSYGLLSYNDVLLYIKKRESMKRKQYTMMFESGRMYKFAVYKTNL